MNKLYQIIIISFVFFLSPITGCKKNKKLFSPTLTSIQGTVNANNTDDFGLQETYAEHIKVDSAGNFSIQISLSEAGIYSFINDNTPIFFYIQPGDNITANLDFIQPDRTTFTGNHALENQFLQAFNKAKQNWKSDSIDFIFKLPENDFIKKIEEKTQYLIDFQQKYQKEKTPFTEIFADLIADEISYDAAIQKMQYPLFYNYYNPDSTLKLSDTYDTFLQNIDLNDDQSLLTPSFPEFLSLFLDFSMSFDTLTPDESAINRKFMLIADKFTNNKIREFLYYDVMKNNFKNTPDEAAEAMDAYLKVQNNETFIREIKNLYSIWKPLLKGEKAPEWIFKDIHKKDIGLSSFRGKVVYIDLWATWCKPCIESIPAFLELQKAFYQKPIEFISISLDQDRNEWLKAIKKHKLSGYQLISDKAWDSDIIKDYHIENIPRYILIDKNGNILNVHAPRPDDKNIHSILTEAIIN